MTLMAMQESQSVLLKMQQQFIGKPQLGAPGRVSRVSIASVVPLPKYIAMALYTFRNTLVEVQLSLFPGALKEYQDSSFL